MGIFYISHILIFQVVTQAVLEAMNLAVQCEKDLLLLYIVQPPVVQCMKGRCLLHIDIMKVRIERDQCPLQELAVLERLVQTEKDQSLQHKVEHLEVHKERTLIQEAHKERDLCHQVEVLDQKALIGQGQFRQLIALDHTRQVPTGVGQPLPGAHIAVLVKAQLKGKGLQALHIANGPSAQPTAGKGLLAQPTVGNGPSAQPPAGKGLLARLVVTILAQQGVGMVQPV